MKKIKTLLVMALSVVSMKAFGAVVQVKGSDTIVNMSQSIVEEYMMTKKGARVAVTGGGSGVGISGLINKTVDIAMSSRDIKDSEIESAKKAGIEIVETTVGFDGLTVIANSKSALNNISKDDLGKIFRGEVTNWKQLGGADAAIVVLSRDSSSGTHEFFKEHIVRKGNAKGTEEYGAKTLYMPSNEAIKEQVKKNPNAIGYIGMGYMDKTVKALNVDNIAPTFENVFTKKYPIARAVYWISAKNASAEVKDLVSYATSKAAQEIVKFEGFVPVTK